MYYLMRLEVFCLYSFALSPKCVVFWTVFIILYETVTPFSLATIRGFLVLSGADSYSVKSVVKTSAGRLCIMIESMPGFSQSLQQS